MLKTYRSTLTSNQRRYHDEGRRFVLVDMFELSVKTRFSAAHRLHGYPGDCARVHGHNWEVTVVLQADTLNDVGIAVDFRQIKDHLHTLVAQLDHADLNEHPAFRKTNPTSERLAQFLYQELHPTVREENAQLIRVEVSEAPDTAAAYFEP